MLKVLEEARALRKQLLHADQTVLELTDALKRAQFASLAARKVVMQQAEFRKSHYTVSSRASQRAKVGCSRSESGKVITQRLSYKDTNIPGP